MAGDGLRRGSTRARRRGRWRRPASRRWRPSRRARVRRRRLPVAMRSTTRPVNMALTSEASTWAAPADRPSATRRCSMSVRHSPTCSARTWPGEPAHRGVERGRPPMPEADEGEVLGRGVDPPPPLAQQVGLREGGAAGQPALALALRCSSLAPGERGDEQVGLGAEVVDEAVEADPERLGHGPQRHAGQPVVGQVRARPGRAAPGGGPGREGGPWRRATDPGSRRCGCPGGSCASGGSRPRGTSARWWARRRCRASRRGRGPRRSGSVMRSGTRGSSPPKRNSSIGRPPQCGQVSQSISGSPPSWGRPSSPRGRSGRGRTARSARASVPVAISSASCSPAAGMALKPHVPQPVESRKPSTPVKPMMGEKSIDTSQMPAHCRRTRRSRRNGQHGDGLAGAGLEVGERRCRCRSWAGGRTRPDQHLAAGGLRDVEDQVVGADDRVEARGA